SKGDMIEGVLTIGVAVAAAWVGGQPFLATLFAVGPPLLLLAVARLGLGDVGRILIGKADERQEVIHLRAACFGYWAMQFVAVGWSRAALAQGERSPMAYLSFAGTLAYVGALLVLSRRS